MLSIALTLLIQMRLSPLTHSPQLLATMTPCITPSDLSLGKDLTTNFKAEDWPRARTKTQQV